LKASDLLFSSDGDPSWLLIEEGIDFAREREIESIFALANGYLGTRCPFRKFHPAWIFGVMIEALGEGCTFAYFCQRHVAVQRSHRNASLG